MLKVIIAGKIAKAELSETQNKVEYIKCTIERSFIKQDGHIQVFNEYVTIFSEYLINLFKNHYIQTGSYVYGEGTMNPDIYIGKDKKSHVALNIVLNNLIPVDLEKFVANETQAPVQPTTSAPTAPTAPTAPAAPTQPQIKTSF